MTRRQERVSEQIHRAISELLTFQTQDPRLAGVTVTNVDITGDLRRATVYVQPRATQAETVELLEGLQHAHGYLRRQVAERLQLRFAPELRFAIDENTANESHIQELIDQLSRGTS